MSIHYEERAWGAGFVDSVHRTSGVARIHMSDGGIIPVDGINGDRLDIQPGDYIHVAISVKREDPDERPE